MVFGGKHEGKRSRDIVRIRVGEESSEKIGRMGVAKSGFAGC